MVIDAFAAASRANSCTVHGPIPDADAPTFVAHTISDITGDDTVVAAAADDPALRGLSLAFERTVVSPRDDAWKEQLPHAAIGVTGARLAVAEQGVVALACGPDAPRAASLLPPVHLCVVFTDTIVETFAAAIEAVAGDPLPSALTWIGGPSRTGDLEMVQTLGVHGPKTVHIVLVDPAS